MTAANKPTWKAEDRDCFVLTDVDGAVLLSVFRTFPVRQNEGHGLALYVDDRTKPATWGVRVGWGRTAPLGVDGSPGMSVREAKKLALELLGA